MSPAVSCHKQGMVGNSMMLQRIRDDEEA